MRPGVKGTVTLTPAFFAACSTPAQPASTIRSASETFLPPDCADLLKSPLDAFERLQHLRELRRLIDLPVLLRRKANTRAIRAAALVGAAERGRRGPGRRHELRDRQPRSQHLGLERGDVLVVDQRVIDRRNRVLPDELFARHFRAEVTRARTHVAVRQLEPGAGERVGELIRVLHEAPRNLFVRRIEAQRKIGGQHRRHQLLRLDRARAESSRRRPWRPTGARRPGSSSVPTRSRTGSRRSCCSTSSASWSR